MTKKRELAVNTLIIGIGKFGTQILSFLLLPLYTSALSTKEYGIYDLILTVSIFVVPIITLLMEESMFRFLIDATNDNEKKSIISQVVKYIFKRTGFCSLLFIPLIIIFKDIRILIGLLYIISMILMNSSNAVLRGLSKIKLYSAINFINNFCMIILNVLFITVFNLGYRSLLYSPIIVNFLSAIFVFSRFKIFKSLSIYKSADKINEMKKYSSPLVPNSISWSIINTSDRLIISSFLGTGANGIYSISNKFSTIMDSAYSFFYTAWKESAAKAIRDNDTINFYNNIYDMLKRLLFSAVIGICASLPLIFNVFIGEEFNRAYAYIPILILATYYSNVSGFYGGIFSAFKNTKIMGITTIISAIINIIINLMFIRHIFIWAAAGSTLVSTFIVYIIRRIKLKEFVNLKEDSITLFLVKILSIVIVFSTYYFDSLCIHILVFIYVVILSFILNLKLIKSFKGILKNKFRL